jgi:hypothetical protein
MQYIIYLIDFMFNIRWYRIANNKHYRYMYLGKLWAKTTLHIRQILKIFCKRSYDIETKQTSKQGAENSKYQMSLQSNKNVQVFFNFNKIIIGIY